MTAIYLGNGDWIPGVPARNLSEEEYAKHKDTIDANAAATGRVLYVEAEVEEEGDGDGDITIEEAEAPRVDARPADGNEDKG